jgi:putative membrane protein
MMMLYIKSLHIIAIIAWFAGLFYLPRLFVYHAECDDKISQDRFKIMERRLYKGIMIPAMVVSIISGVCLIHYNVDYYTGAAWMSLKLFLVVMVIVYHFTCGYFIRNFKRDTNSHTSKFYRFFNEIPTLLLIFIVILVVVKPSILG